MQAMTQAGSPGQCRVIFEVTTAAECTRLSVVGAAEQLGAWNIEKSVVLSYYETGAGREEGARGGHMGASQQFAWLDNGDAPCQAHNPVGLPHPIWYVQTLLHCRQPGGQHHLAQPGHHLCPGAVPAALQAGCQRPPLQPQHAAADLGQRQPGPLHTAGGRVSRLSELQHCLLVGCARGRPGCAGVAGFRATAGTCLQPGYLCVVLTNG